MDRLSLEDLSAILADYDFECSTRLKSLKLSSSSHLDSLARSTKSIIVQLPDAVRHLAIHVILSEYQGDLTRAERAETEKRLRAHHFPGPSVGGGKGKRSALEEEEEDDDDLISTTPLKSRTDAAPSSTLKPSTAKKIRSVLTNPPPPSASKRSTRQPPSSSTRTTRTTSRKPLPSPSPALEDDDEDRNNDWSLLDSSEASRVESNSKPSSSKSKGKQLVKPSPLRRSSRSRPSSLSSNQVSHVPTLSTFDYIPPELAPSYEALMKAEVEFEKRQKVEREKYLENMRREIKGMGLGKNEERLLLKKYEK